MSDRLPGRSDYEGWVGINTMREEAIRFQRSCAKDFVYQPLITVLVVLNGDLKGLEGTLASLIDQTYDQWDVCVGTSENFIPDVQQRSTGIGERLHIIPVTTAETALGQLEQAAQGDYFLLLESGDQLAHHALFRMVEVLNKDQKIDGVYFDEDLVDQAGKRSTPFFKPDWSPELLISTNYLGPTLWRRALSAEVGGFDPDTGAAQTWDMAFRMAEKGAHIAHIPDVLVHQNAEKNKEIPAEQQISTVAGHLTRVGISDVTVEFEAECIRATWPIEQPLVSVIIPTINQLPLLQKCLDSLLNQTIYDNLEIILVDTGSNDPEVLAYYQTLREDTRIKKLVYEQSKFNFSAANNQGVRESAGEYLLFLNNDTKAINPDWLEEMVRWAQLPEIGVVGATLLFPDDTLQHAGVVVGMSGHANHLFAGMREPFNTYFGKSGWYRNFSAVTAACMMIPKAVFEQVGGFDNRYELVFSDIELCVRIVWQGYRAMVTPYAHLYHYEGRSRGKTNPAEDIVRGAFHLIDIIDTGDPYYNVNLSYLNLVPTPALPGPPGRLEQILHIQINAMKELYPPEEK